MAIYCVTSHIIPSKCVLVEIYIVIPRKYVKFHFINLIMIKCFIVPLSFIYLFFKDNTLGSTIPKAFVIPMTKWICDLTDQMFDYKMDLLEIPSVFFFFWKIFQSFYCRCPDGQNPEKTESPWHCQPTIQSLAISWFSSMPFHHFLHVFFPLSSYLSF